MQASQDAQSPSSFPEVEPPAVLENRKRTLNDSLKAARKRLKEHGSFDASFWTQAARVEEIEIAKSDTQRKISLQSFRGNETEWEKTDEAKAIFERIKAQEQAKKICDLRIRDLNPTKPRRGLRPAFMKLFATSKAGLNIPTPGAGRRDPRLMSAFRSEMIEKYNAKHDSEDFLWCPVLAAWCSSDEVIAAHLFAYMHGQATMDAIFGSRRPPELFSARNGILISSSIERYLDCGKLVIVPDLPERPKIAELLVWVNSDVRNFKIRVLDRSWVQLGKLITPYHNLRYQDLDNRPLQFRSTFRPAARYSYFHYCIQILRSAWQRNSQGGPAASQIMKDESGKPFWGTPGRYLPRNMLLAIVEELGHEYEPLLEGASSSRSVDSQLLLEIGSKQVTSRRPALKDSGFGDQSHGFSPEGDDGEDDEDEDDDDDVYDGDEQDFIARN
jgi:hypothetical protein